MRRVPRWLALTGLLVSAGACQGSDAAGGITLEVHERIRTYEVQAPGLNGLVEALGAQPPRPGLNRRAHALTEIVLDSRLTLTPTPAGCHWEGPEIILEVTTWLPKWVEADVAPAASQKRWRALRRGLDAHEAGHRDLAREAAAEWLQDIQAIERAAFTTQPCRAIQHRLASLRTRVLLRLQMRQDRYDMRTRFGAQQGAVLEINDAMICRRSAGSVRRTCESS